VLLFINSIFIRFHDLIITSICHSGFVADKYRNLKDTKIIYCMIRLIAILKMPVLSSINRHDYVLEQLNTKQINRI